MTSEDLEGLTASAVIDDHRPPLQFESIDRIEFWTKAPLLFVCFEQFEPISEWIVDVNVVVSCHRFSVDDFVSCVLQTRNDNVQTFNKQTGMCFSGRLKIQLNAKVNSNPI